METMYLQYMLVTKKGIFFSFCIIESGVYLLWPEVIWLTWQLCLDCSRYSLWGALFQVRWCMQGFQKSIYYHTIPQHSVFNMWCILTLIQVDCAGRDRLWRERCVCSSSRICRARPWALWTECRWWPWSRVRLGFVLWIRQWAWHSSQ